MAGSGKVDADASWGAAVCAREELSIVIVRVFRSEPNLGLSGDKMADGRQIQTAADVSGNVVPV